MIQWFKELLRTIQVGWALRIGPYPKALPNPRFSSRGPKQNAAIDQLDSVGVFLGPYRNLTTLSAAILFLHPECQVLNHAGARILDRPELNFFLDYTEEKFRNFCHFALTMSQGGARGSYGGSIMLAHAYADHSPMREAYLARYGANLKKPRTKSLVWKESQRVTNILRRQNSDLDGMLTQNKKLRFLLPIRNPIDTALSISRIGMERVYGDNVSGKVINIIDKVLDDMYWFLEWEARYPERFFHFFQNRLDADTLTHLADFLQISADERWVQDTLAIYKLRVSYDYETNVQAHYEKRVAQLFQRQPDIYTQFMSFVDSVEVVRREG